jgi:hypothetical protein
MRRRLIALLSLVGLAGSMVPAQAPKGASQGAETKSESQIKLDKAKQENKVARGAAAKTNSKNSGHASEKAATAKNSKQIHPDYTRYKKADGSSKDPAMVTQAAKENSAAKDVAIEKKQKTTAKPDALTVKQKTAVHPDALTVKQKTGTQAPVKSSTKTGEGHDKKAEKQESQPKH